MHQKSKVVLKAKIMQVSIKGIGYDEVVTRVWQFGFALRRLGSWHSLELRLSETTK